MFSYLPLPKKVMNIYRSLKACHVTKSILTDSLERDLLYSVTSASGTLQAVLRFPALLSRWQCRLKRHRFFPAADRNHAFQFSHLPQPKVKIYKKYYWVPIQMGTNMNFEMHFFVDSTVFHYFQIQLCELYFSE